MTILPSQSKQINVISQMIRETHSTAVTRLDELEKQRADLTAAHEDLYALCAEVEALTEATAKAESKRGSARGRAKALSQSREQQVTAQREAASRKAIQERCVVRYQLWSLSDVNSL